MPFIDRCSGKGYGRHRKQALYAGWLMTRALTPNSTKRAQNGVLFRSDGPCALEEGKDPGRLLTERDSEASPQGRIAKTKETCSLVAGSSYVNS